MDSGARLPFPRGSTASAFNTQIASNIMGGGLVSPLTGKTTFSGSDPYRPDLVVNPIPYQDFDSQLSSTTKALVYAMTTSFTAGTILTPGTKRPVKLRPVQASADFTVMYIGQLIQFSATATEFGVVAHSSISGTTGLGTTTAGICSKPIDNRYPIGTTIKAYDWFWVIDSGPAYVTLGNSQAAGGAQKPLTYYSAGLAGPAGTAAESVLGTTDTGLNLNGSAATGDTSNLGHGVILMYVSPLLQPTEA